MGGYVAGTLVGSVLELLLCLLTAGKYGGLKWEPTKWLLTPVLGAALGGLNASLLFRVMRNSGVAEIWTILLSLSFGGGLYTLVQWLLRYDEQNDQNNS